MKKIIRIISAAAVCAAVVTACNTSGKSNVKVDAELPSASEIDSVSYLIGINFGYFIKANNFGEDLNYAQIKKGMMDFITAEGMMNTPEFNEQFKINPEEMNKLFSAYIAKRNNYEAAVNKAEGEEFMSKNKMKDGVEVSESGLQYKILDAGSDVRAESEADTVWVHYTGTLLDGTVFDETDKTKEPTRLVLTRVIKGWQEGLQLVGEGGHVQLFVPDSLAYGARRSGLIGPNSTIIFDVTVEKVGKTPVVETPDETPATRTQTRSR